MPPVIGQPTAIGTLPHSLSTKFTEAHSVLMNMNQYHDLTSQRVALVTGGRRSWQISKRLDALSVSLLRQFCYAAKGGAFYFYNPSETNPPYSNNPSGTAGRYLVRFASDWSQTTGMSRSDTSIELIEVSPTGAIDIGAPIVSDVGPGPGGDDGGDGGGTTPSAGAGAPIDAPNEAYLWSPDQQWVGYGPIVHGGLLWTYGIAGTANDYPGGPGVYNSSDGTTWVMQTAGVPLHHYPFAAFVDSNAGTITLLVLNNVQGNAKLIEFDMGSGTYGSLSPSVKLGSTSEDLEPVLWHINLFKLSNGSYRVVYEVANESTPPLVTTDSETYFLDYSAGGGWTPQTLIVGSPGNYYKPASVFQDGDTIHLFYAPRSPLSYDGNIVALTGYQYVRIAGDGTMSSPVSLNGILNSAQWILNTGITSGNNVLVPVAQKFTYTGDDTPPTNMGVLVGTPKSSPTFTFVPIPSASIRSDRSFGPYDIKMIHLGSVDYFAWAQGNYDTHNNSLIYISKSSNGGSSWSTPVLLLSLDATPPVDGAPERDIVNFSLGTQLDGSLGLEYTTVALTYYAPVSFT